MSITGDRPQRVGLIHADDGLADLDTTGLLADAEQSERLVRYAQARQLAVAVAWADANGAVQAPALDGQQVPGVEGLVSLGGAGTPRVAEFAVHELGAVLGISPGSARVLVTHALDLRHRLPSCWRIALTGQAPVSYARRVANKTHMLSVEAAASVDREMAGMVDRSNRMRGCVLGRVPWARFVAKLDAAVIRADRDLADERVGDAAAQAGVFVGREAEHGHASVYVRAEAPDVHAFAAATERVANCLGDLGMDAPFNQRQAREVGILADPALASKVIEQAELVRAGLSDQADANQRIEQRRREQQTMVLHVHLTDQTLSDHGAGRRPCGPAATGAARVEQYGPVIERMVREWAGHATIVLKPVIDLNDGLSVDAYEAPGRLRERVILRTPADPFPYSSNTSRSGDLDHTDPYVFRNPDGLAPPGQTRDANLSRMIRTTHRLKTHGRWRLQQIRSGMFLWTSPHGYQYLVDHTGTTPLGRRV